MTDLFKATLAVLLMTAVAFAPDAAAVSIGWTPVPFDRFENSDASARPIIAFAVAAFAGFVAVVAIGWVIGRVGRRIVSSFDRFSARRQ